VSSVRDSGDLTPDLLVCTESLTFDDGGGRPVFVNTGTIVRAGNPLIRGREQFFVPLMLELGFDDDLPASLASVVVVGKDAAEPAFGTDSVRATVRRTRPVHIY
jgi:hypothetical protein